MNTIILTSEQRARFWSKVEKLGTECGCWLWTGECTKRGYGQCLRVGNTVFYTHRVSYALNIGPIPAGQYVCHSCDVPACVNPDHLWLGTQLDNMRDCKAKGRYSRGDQHSARRHPERLSRGAAHSAVMRIKAVRGEQHHKSKLTTANALEIRERYSRGGILYAQLAADFGVHHGLIGEVIRRNGRWANV